MKPPNRQAIVYATAMLAQRLAQIDEARDLLNVALLDRVHTKGLRAARRAQYDRRRIAEDKGGW